MDAHAVSPGLISWAGAVRTWLIALAAVLAGVAAAGQFAAPGAQPARSAPIRAELGGLAAVPMAAAGPVSAALGRDDHTFWVHGSSAENRAEDLSASFSAAGVSVRSGVGHVRLSVTGFGRAGAVRPLRAANPAINANRVVYERGAVREWYANGPLGLEQGFDVAQRPAGASRQIQLSLRLTGDLRARLNAGGVLLTGADGSLRYTGLIAVDNRGRRLAASLGLGAGRLTISVLDRGALYPVHIDPFVQVAELTAADPTKEFPLGYSSAVSGSTVVVGASASTVGSTTGQGEVAVFTKPSSGWANTSQAAILTASDGATNDSFGFSVAIDGSTIVAGSPQHNGGTAYVYVEPPTGWASTSQQNAELTPTGPITGYLPVAISGNTIAIGRAFQTVNGHSQQGAVDVFVKPTTGWANSSSPLVLSASDGVAQGTLGVAVAISPSTVSPTTIAAGAGTGGGTGSAVYVFSEPPGGWASTSQQTAELQIGNAGTVFSGAPVLADTGSTIAVGNTYATVGSNAQQGAVYVYAEPTTGWANSAAPSATLTASGGAAGEDLGFTVSASGTTIVAGAPGAGSGQGAAYVFTEPITGWASTGTPTQELTNTPTGPAGQLGYSVGIDGSTIVAGARAHNLGEFVYEIPGSTTTTTTTTTPGGPTTVPTHTVPPVITGTAKAGGRLSCSTGTWTQSPTAYAFQWSRDGTPIRGATSSTYTVQRSDEGLTLTCTVTASNAKGAGLAASGKGIPVVVPRVAGCPAATGGLSGATLGLVKLGMTRSQARHAYKHSSNRGRKYEDFFCLTPIGVRVGYASPALATTLSKAQRTALRDHVIWASTSSAHYAVKGVRVGATIAAASAVLKPSGPFRVGLNDWYFAANGGSTAILKVRGGLIEEVGIADKSLTQGSKAQRTFLKSFS